MRITRKASSDTDVLLRDGTRDMTGNLDLDANALLLDEDGDTYIDVSTDNIIDFFAGGTEVLNITTAGLDLLGKLIKSSSGPLQLGKTASSGHSLGTDDTLVGGALEVDGITYFDGNISLADNLEMATVAPTSDVIPGNFTVQVGHAYAQAGLANDDGANIYLYPGLGVSFYTVLDNLSGNTLLTVTINDGAPITATAGLDFALGSDNTAAELAVTATNAAAYLNGLGTFSPYFVATGVNATLYLQPNSGVHSLKLATSQPTRIFLTQRNSGSVVTGANGLVVADGAGIGYSNSGPVLRGATGQSIAYLTANGIQTSKDINMPGTNKLYSSNGALNLGTAATTGHSLASGDVICGGDLEVDGAAYFDAGVTFYAASSGQAAFTMIDNNPIQFGSGADVHIYWATNQTPDTLFFGLGSESRTVIIGEKGDASTDLAYAQQTNPTVRIISANAPADPTQWISLAHDQTDGVIDTGKGGIKISGQGFSAQPAALEPSGTTQTVDWDNGNGQVLDLGSASGDVTLTLSNPKSGASYIIKIIQGATPRDLVWPAAVLWSNGDALTSPTETNDAVDVVAMYYDGTNYFASYSQAFA